MIGTEVSIAATPQDDTDGAWFNYTDYEHNALRLLPARRHSGRAHHRPLSVLTEIRSENGDEVTPYALYVRVRPWRDRPIDIQAGRIPPTFGAFARRNYGAGNPLIGYPLAYQYLTAVRPDALPASTDDVLADARARMAAQLSHRLAGDRARAATHHGVPVGHRRAGARRARIVERQRRRHERHHCPIRARATTTAANRSPDACNGSRAPRSRSALSAATGAYVADAALAAATMLGGTGDRRSRQSASMPSSRAITGCCAASHLEPLAGADALAETSLRTSAVPRRPLQDSARPVRRGAHRSPRSAVVSSVGDLTWDAPVTRLEAGVGYYIRRNLLAKERISTTGGTAARSRAAGCSRRSCISGST